MCLEIWIMRIAVSNVVSEYSLGGVLYLIVLWFVRCSSSSSSSFVIPKKSSQSCTLLLARARVVVVVRHTQKIHPIVHAATGARACPSNGICRICDFDFWHEKSI